MEISVFINNLRDPMGLPFYPIVFQGLMVLTFALHIFVANIVVGSLLLVVLGKFGDNEYRLRLARTLAKVATIATSVAVVLAVAPLLFIQVIYDPIWYSANLLSAWWAMLFLLLVMIGFLAAYSSYLRMEKPSAGRLSAVLSLACISAAGVIIHMLNMESLLPQFWAEWFSGNNELATSGWQFHAVEFGRLGHFIAPAVINVGIFMMLYGWYLGKRNGVNGDYLEWTAALGARLTRIGLIVQVVFGLWWLFALPQNLRFFVNPGFHFGVTFAVIAAGVLFWTTAKPMQRAPISVLISIVAILAMSVSRETLRMAYLDRFDYSIYSYPVQVDWGSTLLFFATFIAGLIVMAYPLMVAFKAGRGEEV